MPQQHPVAQPNLNAVPAARADKDMQDWLNGFSHDKEKTPNVYQPTHKAVKSSCSNKNGMLQNASKPAQARTSDQVLSNQTQRKSQRSTQRNMPPGDLNLPLSIDAPKQALVPTKGVEVVEAISATIQNSQAIQPGSSSAIDTVDGADELSGLAIVAQWHLRRQARRKERAETKRLDLLDINSPLLTPPRNFFEKEDMPLSLPAPIVPSQSSHEGPMTAIEEDLMQFPDPTTGKSFGVLIAGPTESRAAEGFPGVDSDMRVQSTTFSTSGNRVKTTMTTMTVSTEVKLGAAAEALVNNVANTKKSIKAQGSSGCN